MIDRRRALAFASGLAAASLALATAAMTTVPHNPNSEPEYMSGLKVEGLAGYDVVDLRGLPVGEVIHVQADHKGRTRYVRISLDGGGEARIAAFRASLNADQRRIGLHLPRDLVLAEAS
ncbi:MAG: hypothetical protein SGJ21_00535 [Alphaproteobacteria bacterium]|nr:hypothetical protein [Alphaproteobacteria bacterium]